MKKLSWFLFAVCVLFLSAGSAYGSEFSFGDSKFVELDWEDYEGMIENEVQNWTLYSFDKAGISIYLPDFLQPVKKIEQTMENNIIGLYRSVDEKLLVRITYDYFGFTSPSDVINAMSMFDVKSAQELKINGLSAAGYMNPFGDDMYSVEIIFGNGYSSGIAFSSTDDPEFRKALPIMIASLRETD